MKYFQSGSVLFFFFFFVHGAIYATNVVNYFYRIIFVLFSFIFLCTFVVLQSLILFLFQKFFFIFVFVNDNNSGPLTFICLVMNIGKFFNYFIYLFELCLSIYKHETFSVQFCVFLCPSFFVMHSAIYATDVVNQFFGCILTSTMCMSTAPDLPHQCLTFC